MRRFKLVHVTTVPLSLNFFRGQIGYLKSNGFEVHAISSPGGLLDQVGVREGIEVHAVPIQREMNPLADIVSLWRIWRTLRALRPDVVHSHTPKAGLLGTIAARAAGARGVMLSIFGLPQMTRAGFSRRLLNFTTRLSCLLADRVWCDSFSMRDYIAREGLCAPEKLVVLGHGSVNGVDAEGAFSPVTHGPAAREAIRLRYGIPSDALTIGFVGRIVADKGMHELASAWRILRERFPTLQLLLVGPPEPQDPLQPADLELFRNDSRVHLAGLRTDTAAHFAAMDVFVMPSYREGFGVTNIEAAAMALPVVSTRIPGCVDSVQDGVTGTLVPARDAEALASAIGAYCDNEPLRRTHGQAGRTRVLRDFQQKRIWEDLRREYIQLIGEERAS